MQLSRRRLILTYSAMTALIGGAIVYAEDPALGSANSPILARACAAKPAGTPTALVSPAATTPCPGETGDHDNDSDDVAKVHVHIKAETMQPAASPSPTPTPTPAQVRQNVTVTVAPVTQVTTPAQTQAAPSPSPSPVVTHVVFVQAQPVQAVQTTAALPQTGGSAK